MAQRLSRASQGPEMNCPLFGGQRSESWLGQTRDALRLKPKISKAMVKLPQQPIH